jgi:serine/threonine protein kinase
MEGLSVTYAAPEQFEPDEFGDPDMLTDIYQVGALVHAMLTGEPPYSGSQLSVMRDVVAPETPSPPKQSACWGFGGR